MFITRMIAVGVALGVQAGAALAQPGTAADRTEQMLRDLLRKDQPVAKRAVVVRTAKIKLIGRINKVGTFSRPVRCYFGIYYDDGERGFSEQKDQEAVFNGNVGKCEITIPFRWKVADDSQSVETYAFVSNLPEAFGVMVAKAAGTPVYRSSEAHPPDVPLPAEDKTKVVRFSIDF